MNKKTSSIWWRLAVGYFFFSIFACLIFSFLIKAFADEASVYKTQYKAVASENRELKKLIAQKGIDETIITNDSLENNEFSGIDYSNSSVAETYETEPDFTDNSVAIVPFDNSNSAEINNGSNPLALYGGRYSDLMGEIVLKSNFAEPLEGAYTPAIATYASCLPGAPRAYRNGHHQGTDYYSYDCGNACVYGTPVLAVSHGIIARIDHDYVEMNTVDRNEMLDIMADIVADPDRDLDQDLEYQEYFDLLRGRQVIIDHGNGLYSDYCHLSDVNKGLSVGDEVLPGDVVGYLGNSGTSKAAEDNDCGYVIGFEECRQNPGDNQMRMIEREWHLHLEYWYCPDGIENPLNKTNYLGWESVKKLYGY